MSSEGRNFGLFIEFRNDFDPIAIFFQVIFVCLTAVTLVGIVYFIFVLFALIIHHYIYDRRLDEVPEFIRMTINNESDSSSSNEEYDLEEIVAIRQMEKLSKQEVKDKFGTATGPTYSKKTLILEKFIHDVMEQRKLK